MILILETKSFYENILFMPQNPLDYTCRFFSNHSHVQTKLQQKQDSNVTLESQPALEK